MFNPLFKKSIKIKYVALYSIHCCISNYTSQVLLFVSSGS